MKPPARILIISYSLSGQTNGLLTSLISGLEGTGCQVHHERLQPLEPIRFPFGSVTKTLAMMLRTLWRQRFAIKPLSAHCHEQYSLVMLAGPTWSYNPSGPILSLLDRDGGHLLKDKPVLPMISCRGYWRTHLWGLKRLIKKYQGRTTNAIIFSHPVREPWRTLGVFLKLCGRHPETMALIGRYYPRYGHDRVQQERASEFGRLIGTRLMAEQNLADIDFQDRIALP